MAAGVDVETMASSCLAENSPDGGSDLFYTRFAPNR